MKKIIVIFFLSLFCAGNFFSQSEKKPNAEYLELWVYYNVNNGVNAKMYIDIGKNIYHPLHDVVSNGEADNIVFKGDGITKVFSNEVDIIKYLSDLGWDIVNTETINLMSREYIRYLFVKKE